MKTKPLISQVNRIGFALSAVLLTMLTGCASNGERSQANATFETPPVVKIQDDYTYYPDYQIYYNNTRHEYVYLENGSWLSQPNPPRVSAGVVQASRAEKLAPGDFPAHHRATLVVRQHPGNDNFPELEQVKGHIVNFN